MSGTAHTFQNEEAYHPKDALGSSMSATALTGTAGLLFSGVQNTLARQNYGFWGVFTKSGSTIAIFAAMGGTYAFLKDASANLREKEDTWNSAIGGFFAGAIVGLRARRFPPVIGYGAGLAITLATFEKGGGTLKGVYNKVMMDEVERKEYVRTTRRRPYEETIEEIGEGRGIYGPGYAERRRDRLKAKYGIDVPAASEKPYA